MKVHHTCGHVLHYRLSARLTPEQWEQRQAIQCAKPCPVCSGDVPDLTPDDLGLTNPPAEGSAGQNDDSETLP